MKPVIRITGAAIGGFTDHYKVVPVVFSREGAVAIRTMEDRIIGEGFFEFILVEDGDVRIERTVGNRSQAEAVHLDADTLSFLDGDLIVIDVLGEDHTFDRLVHRDSLGGGEVAVRLLLVHVREGAREELAHVRESGLRADAHDVVAGADARVDRQGELDLIRRAALDGLHLEARGVEHEVLEVFEAGAAERQLDVGTDLAAVRLQGGNIRIGTPRDERGGDERSKVTELHKNVSAGRSPPAAP